MNAVQTLQWLAFGAAVLGLLVGIIVAITLSRYRKLIKPAIIGRHHHHHRDVDEPEHKAETERRELVHSR